MLIDIMIEYKIMNINTTVLLSTLLTKIDPLTKGTIEKLSTPNNENSSSLPNENEKNTKSIKDLLDNLLKDISRGSTNKKHVMDLLENSKQSVKFKNFSSDIKQILNQIQTELKLTPELEKLTEILKNSLVDIKSIDQKVIKNSLQNSGIFLESKLVNLNESVKNKISSGNLNHISGDIKKVLLQIQEHINNKDTSEFISKELKFNVEKTLSQIDYFQLSSFASNSNHSYISFLQDDIEDADIKFSASQKNEFSCLINLSLKENGNLKILLQLDNKNGLNINIGIENDDFKSMIQSSLQKLRKQINLIGLSVVNLNIFDLKDEIKNSSEVKAYGSSASIEFGLDIKA